MNLSSLSIRHPVPAILLFALLSLLGVLAFQGSKVQQWPDIDLPMVNVQAELDGAAPAQLETEVARKLEDSLATVQGVKHLHTTILDGTVNIMVEFQLDKDGTEAVNEVREAVSRVRSDLPADMRDPGVTKVTNSGDAVMTFAVESGTLDEEALSWFVDNDATKALLAVKGLGGVKRVGGVSREVRVELDPDKMAALRVAALDVSRLLGQVQQESPGGRGDVGGSEQSVRTLATVKTAAELAAIDIPLPDGRHVRLDQVARVTDSLAERRSIALHDGRPVVAFEIFRARGAGELDVAAGAREALEALRARHPDVRITELIDNTRSVQENFDGSMHLLYEGAVLAVLVVWWFLRDARATLISAAALPLSVLPAFLGMKLFGYSLNMVTLTSLALVIGILVDDAIVEIENIARHLRMGKPPLQAAMEAADEIGMAVIATTFALVAVFLPTAFMGGIPGRFFKQFGWTAVLAIMSSLLVARLLTPMMAAYLLKPTRHDPDEHEGWLMQRYMRAMRWCLRHRLVTSLGALGFLAGSIGLIGLLPTGFVPASDHGQTQVNIELPPGSTLAETQALAEQARLSLQGMREITSVFSSVGGGTSGDIFAPGVPAEARRATLTLSLTHRDERQATLTDVENAIRARLASLPHARVRVGAQDGEEPMQIVLRGDDPATLDAAARDAARALRGLQGIGAVTSNASLLRPEIVVRPDFARAADLGVTAADIGDVVRVATAGDYDQALPKLNLGGRQVPIRVKLPDSVRTDLGQLSRLTLPGRDGPVLLASVAALAVESGPARIDRLDRSRNITLDVELGTRALGQAHEEAMALPALRQLPPGVYLADLGETQEMKELFSSFGIAMAIGVLCIYGVLVLLFHDFLQPITILAALPLSIGGAFMALLVTQLALSMPSMIGLIMLTGIVTKNSILLVEYAIAARRGDGVNPGMSRFDALVDACRKRSRPIVMTTIAMGAGMLPLAMGMGADPSFRAPMATAVIGGLVTSTLLSLLVVPALFTYADDVARWLARLRMPRDQAPALTARPASDAAHAPHTA